VSANIYVIVRSPNASEDDAAISTSHVSLTDLLRSPRGTSRVKPDLSGPIRSGGIGKLVEENPQSWISYEFLPLVFAFILHFNRESRQKRFSNWSCILF